MNRNQTKLFLGIALAISGLFASQTFAASACTSTACDPAAAAAACDPAVSACDPAPVACDPAPATCAAPASCDPAAAVACNPGCLSAAPSCGTCSACGDFGCNGLCGRHGCADPFFGKLKKSICEGICWSGYMNAGYFTNFAGDRSNGYTDCWSETTPAFNALYVSATKKAYTGGCGYDVGFGVDFMFGEDARILRSVHGLDENWYTGHMSDGRPSYGFAMPQLYVEAAINNWTIKAGHFYGLLGYEGATANSRFFYTKGLLCSVSPVAQTGILASYNGFENLDITLGWINGWGNGFDNEYGENMVEGAFTYHITECASIKYAFLAGTCDVAVPLGALGPIAPASAKGDASVHNVVFDLQLTRYLESVTLFYYGDFDGDTVLVWGEHLYRDLNCCTKLGFRAEWLKTSIDDTELTTLGIGLNYHPAGYQNLYIRPELRYDKSTNTAMLNGRPDQFTIGFDVMLTF
ncbi:MAG: outer membrane beta-barrel protein [Thermoguttaceae bacterium]|nr:outer membrane beta-barrel protein [Thermoguttaceae bacterium]